VLERWTLVECRDGIERYELESYEDYVWDWPWMICRGSSGVTDNADHNEQIGFLPRAIKELEEIRASYPD